MEGQLSLETLLRQGGRGGVIPKSFRVFPPAVSSLPPEPPVGLPLLDAS